MTKLMQIECPCGAVLEVEPEMAARPVDCPACGRVHPALRPAAPEAAPGPLVEDSLLTARTVLIVLHVVAAVAVALATAQIGESTPLAHYFGWPLILALTVSGIVLNCALRWAAEVLRLLRH